MITVPKMGFGSAPIGDLYHEVDETVAIETVHFALDHGVTLLDTAPLYGRGLAETRLGLALDGVARDRFMISTKVGFLIGDDDDENDRDYSYDGIMYSLEGSLARLKLDSVEILHIHDFDPATPNREDGLIEAFPTMLKLREQGVIKAIGAGMNEWEVPDKLIRSGDFDFDLFLIAGRYTLLEQGALDFFNLCQKKGIGIFAAGVYNTGILATGAEIGAKHNYQSVTPDVLSHAQSVQSICTKHNAPLNAAALQFVAAHPAVSSLVIGAETPGEIEGNLAAMQVPISAELWADLVSEQLIDERSAFPK